MLAASTRGAVGCVHAGGGRARAERRGGVGGSAGCALCWRSPAPARGGGGPPRACSVHAGRAVLLTELELWSLQEPGSRRHARMRRGDDVDDACLADSRSRVYSAPRRLELDL